jgi:hypothetical protein
MRRFSSELRSYSFAGPRTEFGRRGGGNYGLERAERNRLKQAKKEAKVQARKANAGQSPHDSEQADSSEVPKVPKSED